VGTIVLPPLDVQLAEDIGGNSIDVGGRDTVGSKKSLDWSGHLYEVQKGLGQVDPFLRPINANRSLNNVSVDGRLALNVINLAVREQLLQTIHQAINIDSHTEPNSTRLLNS
jgi:hypothetical protein